MSTAAIAGFNFNDTTVDVPVRNETLDGSGTDEVKNLTITTNIGKAGVWIFQVDESELMSKSLNEVGGLSCIYTLRHWP